MIVVVGSPAARLDAGRIVADGSSARIAKAVAAAGRSVQIVGRIGDDAAADAVLQDLARASVGHVAILRDPARATPTTGSEPATVSGGATVADAPPEVDAADIELALRYLTDFRVIVIVEPATPAVTEVVARAIEWGGARLIVASETPSEDPSAMDLPAGAQVVRPADREAESAFADRVAALAVTLDPGPLAAG